MRYLVGIIGVFLVAVVLWEAFETIILPRRVTRLVRVTSLIFFAHLVAVGGAGSVDQKKPA